MQTAGIAREGMSVCLSICLSVALRYCIIHSFIHFNSGSKAHKTADKTNKASVIISSPSESQNILASENIQFIPKFDRGHLER